MGGFSLPRGVLFGILLVWAFGLNFCFWDGFCDFGRSFADLVLLRYGWFW